MRIAAASRGSSCALGGGRRAAEKGDGLSMPVPPLVNEEAGRPAMPIDVANAALFLASEESGNVNGICLVVDGGVTTGSTAKDPPYSAPLPFMREAGRTGLS